MDWHNIADHFVQGCPWEKYQLAENFQGQV
jgi:hypothetical protein